MIEKYCKQCNICHPISYYYKSDDMIQERICRLTGKKTYYETMKTVQEQLQKAEQVPMLLTIGRVYGNEHFCTCRFTDMDKFYDDVRKLRVEEVDKDCPYYTEIFLEILKKNETFFEK